MARKNEVLPPTNLYCVTTLPSETNTIVTIGVKSLFNWLNISFNSIKIMCGCLSQVAMLDVSATILDNNFKTSTPFIDTVINEMLWEFLLLSDYRSLQFFHRLKLSLVVAEEHPK